MSIDFIHARLANAALLFSVICFAWGLLNFIRKQPVTSSYWGALVILQILAMAQVVIGIVVYASMDGGQLARPIVHLLYAATLVISLPAAYVYTGGKDTQRENMIYALVCLWLVFIAERSITTGKEGMLSSLLLGIVSS
ncbi:MAG TPA: hypothetical protein VL334_26790 [Anaerolineae bacterium]|nr:hypothetical protein [Anaerolineae bacterium]